MRHQSHEHATPRANLYATDGCEVVHKAARTTMRRMPERKKQSRAGQKSFALGEARPHIEQWIKDNGYEQNAVLLAALFAFESIPHERRVLWFMATNRAASMKSFQPQEVAALMAKLELERPPAAIGPAHQDGAAQPHPPQPPGRTDDSIAAQLAPGGFVTRLGRDRCREYPRDGHRND